MEIIGVFIFIIISFLPLFIIFLLYSDMRKREKRIWKEKRERKERIDKEKTEAIKELKELNKTK